MKLFDLESATKAAPHDRNLMDCALQLKDDLNAGYTKEVYLNVAGSYASICDSNFTSGAKWQAEQDEAKMRKLVEALKECRKALGSHHDGYDEGARKFADEVLKEFE